MDRAWQASLQGHKVSDTTDVTLYYYYYYCPGGSVVRNLPANAEDVGGKDLLEKEMATHSSILAWKSPWTVKPGSYSPLGYKESDTTEQLSTHPHLFPVLLIFLLRSMCGLY